MRLPDVPEILIALLLIAGVWWGVYNYRHGRANAGK
jgi:hypothetical protein